MASHITTQEAVETWKFAHRFVLDVYRLSTRLPRSEETSLIPKVRTSSVKIASNIVEGYARKSTEFYLRHLSESQVALEETKYSILVARDLGYITEHAYSKVMADAEALSERLENLHQRLAAEDPEAGRNEALTESANEERNSENPALFGVSKGVRESWREFSEWVRQGTAKIKSRRDERADAPNVWVEELDSGPHYLEDSTPRR